MRYLTVVSALLSVAGTVFCQGTIETISGNGTCGYSGDGGQAVQALLCNPQGGTVDPSGDVYFFDSTNWRIRMITPAGIITTAAGNGVQGPSGDGGPALGASLGAITQLVTDGSVLVFGDPTEHKVRYVILSSGTIYGLGTGNAVSAGDGLAWNAVSFNQPSGIELFYEYQPPDAYTGFYVADVADGLVRRIDGITGIASTIVGPGTPGQLGDGGPATAASLLNPAGIRLYNNALYIADAGNNRIRKLDLSSGIITTVAGDGTPGYGGDGGPATSAQIWSPGHITFDTAGNMYFTDRGNYVIRMVDTNGNISTFAGNGQNGAGPDNVPPTQTFFGGVNGAIWNSTTNGLFIADGSNKIRETLEFIPTTTTLTVTPASPLPGDTLTLTATVASAAATGTVTFNNGSTAIGSATLSNGTASISWTPSGVGKYPLKAGYSGDSNYAASTSAVDNVVVQVGSVTLNIVSSQNPSSTGQAVTFTATLNPSAATGTVLFDDAYPSGGGTAVGALGVITVANGVATLTTSALIAATHTISASYSGDSRYGATFPVNFTQIVKNTTTTTVSATPNPASYGASVSLVAQVTPSGATGTVQFFNGAALLATATVASNQAQTTTTGLPVGTNSITATYSGDGNDFGSTSSAVQVTINKANSTTTLAATPTNPTFGQSVTLTAAVSPATSTGSVQFFNGSTLLGTVTIANNQAQLATASLPAGNNSLTAVYSGDGNTNTSTSAVLPLTVAQASTTTTLVANPASSSYGQAVILAASVTPAGATGSVQFFSGGASLGTAPVSSGQAQLTTSALPIGTDSITASYSGDANYVASSSGAVQETVGKIVTATVLSASPSPSTYGQAVTLTAAVTPATATGTVQFLNGGTLLGTASVASGQAHLTTSTLTAGSYTLTAAYSGDATNAASTSSAVSQTVNKLSTSTTLTINPAFPVVGQTVNIIANVTPATATGAVNFYSSSTLLGTSTLNNGVASVAVTATTAGTTLVNLQAVYQGDSNDSSSFSGSGSYVVGKGSTTTSIASSLDPSIVGQSVTFTATVSPAAATGTVTFSGIGTANVSNGVASITTASLPAGTTTVTASYSGDSNYNASASVGLAQSVLTATAVSLTSSPNPSTYGHSVTLTAKVTPSTATGTVQFFNGGTLLGAATLGSGTAVLSTTVLPAGSDSLTAVYSGNANDAPSSSAPHVQTMDKVSSTTKLTANPSSSTTGETVTLTATVTPSSGTGTIEFTDGSTVLGTVALSGGTAEFSTSSLTSGTHSIRAVYSGDSNVNSSESSTLNYRVR